MSMGLKKTELRNHKGDILLPRTTTSMVSEEPNRRFVDNEEKFLLWELATNKDNLLALLEKIVQLRALADKEQEILYWVDNSPTDWDDIEAVIKDLSDFLPIKNDIMDLVNTGIGVISPTTQIKYNLIVDDKDMSKPVLLLSPESGTTKQPGDYKAGDVWDVGDITPDVSLTIPVEHISFNDGRLTILTFEEGLLESSISEEEIEDLMNGAQTQTITGKKGKIPQAFFSFGVAKHLKDSFGIENLDKTVTSFDMKVLSKPDGTTTNVKTQAYLDGNVIQPVRTAVRGDDFSTNSFNNLTWGVSINPRWLNSKGSAGLVVFSEEGQSIMVSKPHLEIKIGNPYRGKTVVAKQDMETEFNILDWEIKE